MYLSVQIAINNNPLLKKYLREHSYYYKILNRDQLMVKDLINNMQREYKLTTTDRLNKVKDNLNMINSLMDILN